MRIFLKILFLTIIVISCSTKKVDLDSQPDILPEKEENTEATNNESPFIQ